MKIISVQVGKPENRKWKDREVYTGIFKKPVQGPVKVGPLNLEGDGQGDLEHHGGAYKAVYSYASEHYDYWKKTRGQQYPWGIFGENLTTEGLDESELNVGDQIRFGSVILEVSQPRIPCSRLGLRFNDDTIIKQFLHSGRPGVYYQVIQPGELKAGDPIEFVFRDPGGYKLVELFELRAATKPHPERLKAWLGFEKLEADWVKWMKKKLGV